MMKVEIQCLIVGHSLADYPGLMEMLRTLGLHISLRESVGSISALKHALKRLRGASLIFIDEQDFDDSGHGGDHPSHEKQASHLSLQQFTDLVWQFASDASVVVLGKKTQSHPFAYNLNDIQINYLNFVQDSTESRLILQFLSQTALLKYDFRRCKRLLGVSEKRCQWLVDSSFVPVAYISRDLHLYANTAYLGLFGIDSIQVLRSIPVKELIVDKEQHNFDSFIRSQSSRYKESQSLFLQMKNLDGSIFRASIKAIPSVFRGKRCLQFWVHSLDTQKIDEQTNDIESKTHKRHSSQDSDKDEIARIWRQDEATEKRHASPVAAKSAYSAYNNADTSRGSEKMKPEKSINPAQILSDLLARNDALISIQPLSCLNQPQPVKNKIIPHYIPHYIVELKLPYAQRCAVNELLMKTSYEDIKTLSSLFWDRVKLTRLFQLMKKENAHTVRLIVRLSEASIKNRKQLDWLQNGLTKVMSKSSMLIFMLPSRLDDAGGKACMAFIQQMKAYHCQFALDDFFISTDTLKLLKHTKPQLLRLSLPWIKGIEGNEKREMALGRVIRQLENRNIRIIAPCRYSQEMKKLFILSGTSFCQEKPNKND